MNTDNLIQFFTTELTRIPELKDLKSRNDPEFTEWWNTIKATCERMGESYEKKRRKYVFILVWSSVERITV